MLNISILINKIIKLSTKYKLLEFKEFKKVLKTFNINYIPKIITVTGTNGKGTTVYILSQLLKINNISHISHISPHINKFNERILENFSLIDDQTLSELLTKIYFYCLKFKYALNYYSISFICILLLVQIKKPTWLILEIGIGGKFDPANILHADISIFTSLSYDHCNLLGTTLSSIALNKVHIARSGKPIIIGEKKQKFPKEAIQYLKNINAKIIYAKNNSNLINVFKHLNVHKNILACISEAIPYINNYISLIELNKINIPGRFEVLNKNPYIIIDIAHNLTAAKNLIINIKKIINSTEYQKKMKITAIFMTKKNKNMVNIMNSINKDINNWILPDLSEIDDNFISLKNFNFHKQKNIKFFENHLTAFNYFYNKINEKQIVVIFGSFLLVKIFTDFYKKILLTKKTNIFLH